MGPEPVGPKPVGPKPVGPEPGGPKPVGPVPDRLKAIAVVTMGPTQNACVAGEKEKGRNVLRVRVTAAKSTKEAEKERCA